ncbi:hypothetical protein KUF83_25575 [Streptomyces sp. BV286]|nr:hypothetical protein [Streptomyces sp. BV286]
MRRRMGHESIRGRRGALGGASAAVVCLGAVLAACGTADGGGGHVAVQRPASSGEAVAPTGDVELVPLEGHASEGAAGDGSSGPARSGGGRPGPADASESESGSGSATSGTVSGSTSGAGSGSGSNGDGDGDGRTSPSAGGGGSGRPGDNPGSAGGSSGGGQPSGGGAGSPAKPEEPGPAVIDVGEPERAPADRRWCEKVTVAFHNTGGSAVRSGTVTFGTHVIGALGIDWATVESTEELPAPIAPGAREEKTWTVCVDAWRVPLGMHVETRDVSVRWD